MRWFSRLFTSHTTAACPPVASETPFYAIGDVHGCAAQLDKLRAQLDPDVQRVYVGDYVDRGDHSADVLRSVMDDSGAIALIGNHEAMMLGFIDEPAKKGARWLRFGGLQTLASFGVSGVTETSPEEERIVARDALVAAMGPDMITWMRNLPASYENGNVTVVHAGANPAEPLSLQSRNTLMWGHPDFARIPRTDGRWVLHGHTIVDAPSAEHGRIAVDTGAYATGRLTAAYVRPDGVTFLTS